MTETATTSIPPVAEMITDFIDHKSRNCFVFRQTENINNYIDVLPFAQMPNIILDNENTDTINTIDTKMIQKYNGVSNNVNDNLNVAKLELNGMLSQTQIKKARCLYNGRREITSTSTTSVRIPVTSNIDWTSQIFSQIKQQVGFIDKHIKISQSQCPVGFTSGPTECNNFYDLYCSNQR